MHKKIKITYRVLKKDFSAIAENPAQAFSFCEAIVANELGFGDEKEAARSEELSDLMKILVDIDSGKALGYNNCYIALEPVAEA